MASSSLNRKNVKLGKYRWRISSYSKDTELEREGWQVMKEVIRTFTLDFFLSTKKKMVNEMEIIET